MTILVDGSNATDIQELCTRMDSSGTTSGGSFLVPNYHANINTHHTEFTIITDLDDKPGSRFHIEGCFITSQTNHIYGTCFEFTATNMRIERI